jgi:galactokinase
MTGCGFGGSVIATVLAAGSREIVTAVTGEFDVRAARE